MRKWEDLRGDRDAIRARLETVISSGASSVLLIAPPAAGLTMLALRMPDLLGKPTEEEATAIRLTQTSYRAQLGQEPPALPSDGRPWRAPHYSASHAALYESRWSEYRLATCGTLYLESAGDVHADALVRILRAAGRDPLGPRLVVGSHYLPGEGAHVLTRELFERRKHKLIDMFDATVYLDRATGDEGKRGGLVLAGLGTPGRGAL